MRPAVRAALAAGLAAVFAGCATITYDAVTVEAMVALNRVAPPDAYERVGRFATEQRAVFLASRLVTVRDAELESAARRALARYGGDAVINLRIVEEFGLIDAVVGAVAQELISTRTIKLEGDIIRWRSPDGPPGGAEALVRAGCRRAAGGFLCGPALAYGR